MVQITYKTALAEGKPYPVLEKDDYLNLLKSNKKNLYTGQHGIYIARQIDLQGQKLFFPFVDIDGDEGAKGDDAIASSIMYTSLSLKILKKLQTEQFFTPIASGNTGFRLFSNILLDHDSYQGFVELVKFEMSHIRDIQPTEDLCMPHQLFVYKGNPGNNKKSLVDRHSEIVPSSLFFNNEMTIGRYKELTAGRMDPDSIIESTERLLNFRAITDLNILGDFGRRLKDYRDIRNEQIQKLFRVSDFRSPIRCLSLEVMQTKIRDSGIYCKIEKRGIRDALSFANLPCPICGKTTSNARAYPPYYKLTCFNSNCAAYKGMPLREWAGITQEHRRKSVPGLLPSKIDYDSIPEAHNKIRAELDSPDSSLILITPGAGKTHIALEHFSKRATDRLIIYCCSNKALKEEAYEKARSLSTAQSSLHMLQARDELCIRARELEKVVSKGYSPAVILCPTCEHNRDCPYYAQRNQINQKGMYFLTHHMLQYVRHLIPFPDVIVLDEDILAGFRLKDECTQHQLMTLGIILQGADFLIIDRILSICRNIALHVIREGKRYPLILPARAMDISGDCILAMLSRQLDRPGKDVQKDIEAIIGKIITYSPHELYKKGVNVRAVEWLKGFLNNHIYSYVLITEHGEVSLGMKYITPIGYEDVPIKLLDATGNEDMARIITGREIVTVKSDIEWKGSLTHIKTSLSRKLIDRATDGDIRRLMKRVIPMLRAKNIMLATYQSHKNRVLEICNEIDSTKDYKVYHFHGPRGVNEYMDCEAVIVLGLPFPNLISCYHDACILFPDEKDADKRDTWAESSMIWELLQGIHRIRPVWKDMTEVVVIGQFWPNALPNPDTVIDLSHEDNWKEEAINRLNPFVREFGFLNPDIGFLSNVCLRGKENISEQFRNMFFNAYRQPTSITHPYFPFRHHSCKEGIDINRFNLLMKLFFDINNIYIKKVLKHNTVLNRIINLYNLKSNNLITLSPKQWSDVLSYFKEQYPHYETFKLKLPHARGNAVIGIGNKQQVIDFYTGLSSLGITKQVDLSSYSIVQEKEQSLITLPKGVIVIYCSENNADILSIGHEDTITSISMRHDLEMFRNVMTELIKNDNNSTIITNNGKLLSKKLILAGMSDCEIHDVLINERIIRNGEDIPKEMKSAYLFKQYELSDKPDTVMAIGQLYEIWQKQQKFIDDYRLRDIMGLEQKVLWIVTRMEMDGIGIDVESMLKQYYEADDDAHIKKEIDNILPFISKDDRYHDDIRQIGTITGRFYSPLHTVSKEFRKFFIAREGYTLIRADYSQFEPRILAGLSGDDKCIEIFENAQDIYEIFAGISRDEQKGKDGLPREMSKAIVLGMNYGASAYTIYEELPIPGQIDQSFRSKSTTDSGAFRPVIPL